MTTMTAEQRMNLASTRLSAWLESFDKLDDPIEMALGDLDGFLREIESVTDEHKCWPHAERDCLVCIRVNVKEARKAFTRLLNLWEARES